jgi:hypothetical protein
MFSYPYNETIVRVLEFFLAAAIVIGCQSLYLLRKDRNLAKAWFLTTLLGALVSLPISLLGSACSMIGFVYLPGVKIFQLCYWSSPLWISGMVIGLFQTTLLDVSIRPTYLVAACASSLVLGLIGGALTLSTSRWAAEAAIPGLVLIYGLATGSVLYIYTKKDTTETLGH